MDAENSATDTCPRCGVSDHLTEPAADADERPTGTLLVLCASCGYELAALPPPESSPEAEPEMEEGSLLPGPDEEPRSQVRRVGSDHQHAGTA